MLEMETIKFTRAEIVDVVSRYVGMDPQDFSDVLSLLIKLGVVSEYIFKEEKKDAK